MTFDLVEIWKHMGPLARGIAGFLLLMMIASIGVVVERTIAFYNAKRATSRFVKDLSPLLKDWKIARVPELADKHKASPLAVLFGAMARKYHDALGKSGSLTPVELARGEADRRMESLGADLRRGMNVLASVGSVAPFVGLLGTVVGIIGAFQGIGATGSAGLGSVMSGISEALIETAFGLLVAIPAVLFYNYLTAKVNSMELALGGSMSELLDEMENNHAVDGVKSEKVQRAA